MSPLLMIAKGAVVTTVSLVAMIGITVGMVWLLYGRNALSGDRYYAQEVTMSIGAGGIIVVALAAVAAFVLFPISPR
jgi:hypothetical protein